MGEYTSRRGLYKPAIGETGWGSKVNQNWDILDAHDHVRSEISDFFSSPFWDLIPDKPSEFPPQPHSHEIADIIDLADKLASYDTLISRIKTEMLTIALNVMMNKALVHAETKDFYSIIADVITPEYPNGFKNTFETLPSGVTFDNDGGGNWTKAIKITLTTIPQEYAQYYIVIQSNTMQIYSADRTLKAEYGAETGVASDFWNNVKSDGSDIRIADQDYSQLYFWIEEFDYANKKAVIGVRLEAGTSELYIAYGNPSATKSDYENPEQVFELFDDFEGTELDTTKWTANYVNSVTYEVVNSNLRITDATKSDGTYWIYNNTDTGSQIKANFTVHDKMLIEWKQKMETQSSATQLGEVGIGLCKSDKTVEVYLAMFDSVADVVDYKVGFDIINGQAKTQMVTINADTYYVMRIVRDGENYKLEAVDMQGNVVYSAVTGSSVAAIEYMAICVGAFGGRPFSVMQIDWIRVSKLADPASFGDAEVITLITTGDFITVTFDFSEGVDKLLITVDSDAQAVYYSTDDGATWNPISPDEETLLPETAYSVKWKFEFATYVRGYAFITW